MGRISHIIAKEGAESLIAIGRAKFRIQKGIRKLSWGGGVFGNWLLAVDLV